MRLLDELTWPELAALDRARTVIFATISPIEEHGPHLPVGTDFYVGQALTQATIAEVERRRPDLCCLMVPPMPLGSGVVPMLGSLGVRPRTVRSIAQSLGRALARDGFRTIVVLSGHMGLTHLLALESAAAYVTRRFGVAMLAPSLVIGRATLGDIESGALFAGLEPAPTAAELRALARFDHGGLLETSVMLHLRADLVRPEYRSLPARGRAAYLGWRGRTPGRFQGYVGQPAGARADVGAALVAALTQSAADLVERAVEGQMARPVERIAGGSVRRRAVPLAVLGALGLAGTSVGLVLRWLPQRLPRWPGAVRR